MKNKIFTFCSVNFPGSNIGLANLSLATSRTRHFELSNRITEGPQLDFFVDFIKQEKPRYIIFGGWSKTYELFINRLRKQNIRFCVYWTSSPAQTDISQETEKLTAIINNRRLKYKFFSSIAFPRCLKQYSKNLYHLPLIFAFPGSITKKQDKIANKESAFIISLFCVPQEWKRKNVLNSLLALSGLKRRYCLYLSGLSKDKYYREILDMLRIKYKDFDWMDRKKYERALGEVDLGLQVSFAESFNYVVAEHLARGIPVITSRMVPASECLPIQLKKRLIVDNADNPVQLRDKIQYFIDRPSVLDGLSHRIQAAFLKMNQKNIEIATSILKNVLVRS